jgi:hypothetical protein
LSLLHEDGSAEDARIDLGGESGGSNNGVIRFDTNGSERVRINDSGNLLVGITSISLGQGDAGIALVTDGLLENARDVGGSSSIAIFNGSSGIARIRGDGDLENTNGNYSATSDPRLKQDVTPAKSQWDDMRDLGQRFVNYRLIESVERQGDDAPTLLSVLADDDFAARFPGLTKTGDDGYRSFKQSVAAMKAIIALSEALQRIEGLEAKLN